MPHKPFEEKHVAMVITAAENLGLPKPYPIQKVPLKSGVSYNVTRKLLLIQCEVSFSAELWMRSAAYSPCGQTHPLGKCKEK